MRATHAVFSTTELLEMILLRLSVFEILIARAVCKYWNLLINSSLQLRRATFRSPDSRGFLTLHPHQLGIRKSLLSAVRVSSGSVIVSPLITSDQLAQYTRKSSSKRPKSRYQWHDMEISSNLLNAMATEKMQGVVLRSMFLTQPPCTAISVSVNGTAMYTHMSLREEGGITFGHVAEIAEKALTQAHRNVHPIHPLKMAVVRIAFRISRE